MKTISIMKLAGFGLAVLLLASCTTTSQQAKHDAPDGARLWAQNCSRCHNSRSPDSYSGVKWDVAMLHMRIRANLTAAEHESIREFLTK